MARTAIAVNRAAKNATTAITTSAGLGITGAVGMYIPASASPDDSVVLYVRETNGGATGMICVKAGSDVANAGQGDLNVIISASSENIISLERTRFAKGATGTIDVDLWGFTGVFACINARTSD
jgi:hypothetical protein